MSTVQKNTIIPLYFNSKYRFDIGYNYELHN